MRNEIKIAALALVAAGLSLTGCAPKHLSPDFGYAVNQNLAAQVADPDARYRGDPAPGTDSARVALAQERYQTGKVIKPDNTGANNSVVGGTGGGDTAK